MNRRLQLLLEILFISVIIIDGFLLLTSSLIPFRAANSQIIAYFDLFTSIILFVGYLIQIRKSRDYKLYLKRNWNLFIVIIPFYFVSIDLMGLSSNLMIIKVLNLIKVLALVFAIRQVGKYVDEFVEKSRLVYGFSFFLAVLIISSITFFLAENGVNPHVVNFEDSFWFVIQTITTVGYGDIIP